MARNKGNKVSVNFKGVEGKRKVAEDGEHLGEVVEVTKEKGEKAPYLKWVVELDDDEGKVYINTSLSKDSLWNLRGLLEALGEEVPDDEMDIDLEEMQGKRLGVITERETYQGKPQAKVVDYFPEDGEDSGSKGGKKNKKKKGKKLSKEEVEEMDRDGLEELITEHELDIDPDDFKKDKKLLREVLDKLDENDLLGDGEEEPEDDEDKKGKKGKPIS